MDVSLQNIAIFLVVLLFSMSIHEMMHAFASNWLGDDTAFRQGRLTFNPLAHIDPIFTVLLPVVSFVVFGAFFAIAKPVQVNFSRLRYGEFGGAIVGMVGPLTNLVIAILCALLFNSLKPVNGTVFYNFLSIAISFNMLLFVFNSIPWPPLDGSRLLYAIAPRPLQAFMENIEAMGYTSIFILIILVYSFSGPIVTIVDKLIHVFAPGLIT
jgi:Zn-dependent protease